MREISPALAGHLGEEVTRLATCWRLQRRDGVLIALTSHDRDLVIEGVRYRADGGMTPSTVRETADLTVDYMEISGILSTAGLPGRDLAQGRFDGARIDIFLVDHGAPEAGSLLLERGTLGTVMQQDGAFRAEIRGLSHDLKKVINEVYSPACRAELGDARCKRSLLGFEREVEVTLVVDSLSFDVSGPVEPVGWYDFGRIRWHLGANAGLTGDVRRSAGQRLTLFQSPPEPVAAGDLMTLTAGCIKSLQICETKFDNVANFRGEPFVPGTDSILEFPGIR